MSGYPHTLRPELHKALKAEGIDYWLADGITFWNRDDGCECLAYGYKANGVPKLAIKVVGLTDPEQAVAITIGSSNYTNGERTNGTCHVVCSDEYSHMAPIWHLSCGHTVQGDVRPSYCPNCGRRVVE